MAQVNSTTFTPKCTSAMSQFLFNNLQEIEYYLKYCSEYKYNASQLQEFNSMINEERAIISKSNRLSLPILVSLIVANFLMILFGAGGSGLVIYSVVRNKQMRTPRNLFIVNLAISDLTLCLFTQPFTLLRTLPSHQPWTLGEFMCKLVAMFQGTNIFVSTISITAIALDRFQVIIYPTRLTIKSGGAVIALVSIWIISFVMASPLLVFSSVSTSFVGKNQLCGENNSDQLIKDAKFAYTIVSMVFQYVVPLVIVSIAYTRICLRIKNRMVNSRPTTSRTPKLHSDKQEAEGNSPEVITPFVQRKQELEQQRQRRTNILLSSIGIIFALSWLPLNLSNLVLGIREIGFNKKESVDTDNALNNQTVILIPALSLLVVLLSACSNPILYGWLNENFRREFQAIFSVCCPSKADPSVATIAQPSVVPASKMEVDKIAQAIELDVAKKANILNPENIPACTTSVDIESNVVQNPNTFV